MTTIKSVHIEGCWPFEYVAPNRRLVKRETMDRANARKKAQYWAKKSATVKTTDGKKLVKLPVREMGRDEEFFERLSQQWKEDVHGTR